MLHHRKEIHIPMDSSTEICPSDSFTTMDGSNLQENGVPITGEEVLLESEPLSDGDKW